MEYCDRCKRVEVDIETDRGYFLCENCSRDLLDCINDINNPKAEEDFYKNIKKVDNRKNE